MINFHEPAQQKRLVDALKILDGFQMKMEYQSRSDEREMAYADSHYIRKIADSVKLVCEAAKKQVVKESTQKADCAYGWAWHCPNCSCFIDPSTYKHCPDCGQALKKR